MGKKCAIPIIARLKRKKCARLAAEEAAADITRRDIKAFTAAIRNRIFSLLCAGWRLKITSKPSPF